MARTNQCIMCGKFFVATRYAKNCSERCRSAYARRKRTVTQALIKAVAYCERYELNYYEHLEAAISKLDQMRRSKRHLKGKK